MICNTLEEYYFLNIAPGVWPAAEADWNVDICRFFSLLYRNLCSQGYFSFIIFASLCSFQVFPFSFIADIL